MNLPTANMSDQDWFRYKQYQTQERFREDIRRHDRIYEGVLLGMFLFLLYNLWKLLGWVIKSCFKLLWWTVKGLFKLIF